MRSARHWWESLTAAAAISIAACPAGPSRSNPPPNGGLPADAGRPAPAPQGAGLIQDPAVLRAKVLEIKDPLELERFIEAQELQEGEGDHPVTEKSIPAYAERAVDVFRANLFGSPEKETILQLRFSQRYYILVFFERTASGWRRILPTIGFDGLSDACIPEGCRGTFCFELAALRKEGEDAIVAHTCGRSTGFEGGDLEDLAVWQVLPSGPKFVAHAELRADGHSRSGPVKWRYTYSFEGGFPKHLVLRPAEGKGSPQSIPLPFDN